MPQKVLHRFFISIVVPSILAIGLFIVSIFTFILPSFEKNMMDRKKDMIAELTNTAWSLIDEYYNEYENNMLDSAGAMQAASSRIEKLRYGSEKKDYFWITNTEPRMIMHPYRKDLNGKSLVNYVDVDGKKIFVEAAKLVKENGQGFINYQWQWKDDSLRIVPKLSYVKGYENWGWIIGTGIYTDDVKFEIDNIKRRLLRISSLIVLAIIITISYVVRQSLKIERERTGAEEKLKLSRLKYKSLVDASTEGTVLLSDNRVVFANQRFKKMINLAQDPTGARFDDLFTVTWENLLDRFKDPDKSVSTETRIKQGNGKTKEVIISVSKVLYNNKEGIIIIVKDVTPQKQLEVEMNQLSYELQTSLLMMNQPISHLIRKIYACNMNASIQDAVNIMTKKDQDIVVVMHQDSILGVVTDKDLRKRAMYRQIAFSGPVSSIMSSPVVFAPENSLLYEIILTINKEHISHVVITGQNGKLFGVIGKSDIYEIQRNTIRFLVNEIESAEQIITLKRIYERVPVLVNAFIKSGNKAQHITSVVTSVSDAIARRLIDLVLEKNEQPPCRFMFMVMGSEGRMEQTLKTDQDNAIVFEDVDENKLKEVQKYFHKIGSEISDGLHQIGYKYCEGNNMAKNGHWVQPISVWKKYFKSWILSSDPVAILDSCIFFDFKGLYGYMEMESELRNYIHGIMENKSVFLYHLTLPVLKYKTPVDMFGHIMGKSDSKSHDNLDIKRVLFQVVAFVRIYALQHNISETNTLLRIEKLLSLEVIDKNIYENLTLSYNYLMLHRFRCQVEKIMNNEPPDNALDIKSLTEIDKGTLKKIFSEIINLQTKLSFDFRGSV